MHAEVAQILPAVLVQGTAVVATTAVYVLRLIVQRSAQQRAFPLMSCWR